jgi:Uma2 family endonuclease
MIQAKTIIKKLTFDEFVAWYRENSVRRYELHNGFIAEIPLRRGDLSEIKGFIAAEINLEISRLQLPYSIPDTCLLKSIHNNSGYQADIIVLDRSQLASEPRWKAESIVTMGSSVRLAVEVVGINCRDNRFFKVSDYEEMGISECWIVNHLGLGGCKFIGNPKQPTLSVCQLVDGEYQVKFFSGNEKVESLAFPELNLTAEQIFLAGLPTS